MPKRKDKGGRPTLMTEKTLDKLKEAYLVDANDIQACFNAGIATDTLYKYQRANPEFIKKKEAWRDNVKYRAKLTVAKGIGVDAELALKLLERRDKENYSTKTESTAKVTQQFEYLIKTFDD